ncbi:integrase core domain-containing protein [Mesorhizobium australicum]|uniref:integrase core domain-containing protein n=1 Tax=Mesorhizobium australicum TaxID=536018 RepID=UPI00333B3B36
MGVRERRDARLQRTGKAHRQRLHRSLQQPLQGGGLKAHWFLTLADAAEKWEDWRRYYNEVRPHGAIGHNAPISLLNPDGAASPPS